MPRYSKQFDKLILRRSHVLLDWKLPHWCHYCCRFTPGWSIFKYTWYFTVITECQQTLKKISFHLLQTISNQPGHPKLSTHSKKIPYINYSQLNLSLFPFTIRTHKGRPLTPSLSVRSRNQVLKIVLHSLSRVNQCLIIIHNPIRPPKLAQVSNNKRGQNLEQ